MEWIAEEAIMLTGRYDKGLLRMQQRYQSQVDMKWLTTLYEKYQPKLRGTYNHAWNAPNYVLSRYIAGVKATEVGWAAFEVKPNMAHLTFVKQIVPSVKGDITMEVSKSDTSYTLNLVSPKHTVATIYIPKGGKTISKVLVNDDVLGQKGLVSVGEDDEYMIFKADAGTWKVSVIYQ